MRGMLRGGKGLCCAAAVLLAASSAQAVQFIVQLSGAEETNGAGVFNLGDPDGFGTAILDLDGDTNMISWNITVFNIAPVTAAHIHIGNYGENGGVRIDFSGQLVGSTTDPDVSLVLANPSGWYVNVHNADYPGGAIRGQVPEPASVALMGLAALPLLRRRTQGA